MTITKEGSLASFYTVNKAPIKHLKVYFSPKQTGSGDPSPENVRPIEGWNNIQFAHSGKSLFPFKLQSYGPIGQWVNGTSQWWAKKELVDSFLKNKTITFSADFDMTNVSNDNTYRCAVKLWSKNQDGTWGILGREGNYIANGASGRSKITWTYTNYKENEFGVTLPSGAIASNPMVELGSLMTEYEPYKGSMQTIDWSNDFGTIYGGYVDLITGEVWKTYDIANLNDPDKWVVNPDMTSSYRYNERFERKIITNDSYSYTLCTIAKVAFLPGDKYGRWNGWNDKRFLFSGTFTNEYTLEQVKQWASENKITISYLLNTPQLITTLTPTQLQTFIGQNNIWSNADRVEVEYDLAESNDELYRRRNIILQSAPHLESVSGNIVNFNTDLVAPIKDAKIYFEPIQEGSGNPSPENIRNITGFNEMNIYKASKNLLNPAYYSSSNTYESNGITFTHDGNGIITMNGTSNGEKSAQVTFSWTQPFDCDYYFCGNTSFGSSVGDVYIWDLTTLARPTQWDGVTTSKSSNVGLQEVKLLAGHRIQFCIRVYYINTTTLVNATAKPILMYKTCTDRTFEPYQGNTIPITFPAVGKNLLDITKTSKINPGISTSTITIQNGIIAIDAVSGSARSHVMFEQIFPAGTYTIQAQNSGAISKGVLLSTTEFDGSSYNSYYDAYRKAISSSDNTLTFTLTVPSQIGLVLPNITNESGNPGTLYDIQLEEGSTATTYEPYTNTIYGGYIDLINGEIVQTHQKIMLTQSVDRVWNAWGTKLAYNATYMQSGTNELTHGKRKPGTVIYSNMLTPVGGTINPQQVTSLTELRYYGVDTRYPQYLFMANPNELSIADWRTWFTGTYANAYAIYELETPIHHQLTPQQLKTLKGVNNIWSDANGPISIQYWTH